MKKTAIYLVGGLFTMSVLNGCAENKTRVAEGAGIGGLIGATAGGIIGHQYHHDVKDLLVGGALGAATGALIGSQVEKPDNVQNNAPISQVTMQQIADWSEQGLTSDEIISRIKQTHSSYNLTPDDINYLRNHNVSERVIEAMKASS